MDMWRTLTECDRMWRVCFQTARMWAKKPHCQVSADENYMCKFHSPTKYLWVGRHEAFVVTCVPGASWSFFSLKSGGVLETLCDRGWIFFCWGNHNATKSHRQSTTKPYLRLKLQLSLNFNGWKSCPLWFWFRETSQPLSAKIPSPGNNKAMPKFSEMRFKFSCHVLGVSEPGGCSKTL